MKIAVEAYRRNYPRTTGALYWQVNDNWPCHLLEQPRLLRPLEGAALHGASLLQPDPGQRPGDGRPGGDLGGQRPAGTDAGQTGVDPGPFRRAARSAGARRLSSCRRTGAHCSPTWIWRRRWASNRSASPTATRITPHKARHYLAYRLVGPEGELSSNVSFFAPLKYAELAPPSLACAIEERAGRPTVILRAAALRGLCRVGPAGRLRVLCRQLLPPIAGGDAGDRGDRGRGPVRRGAAAAPGQEFGGYVLSVCQLMIRHE